MRRRRQNRYQNRSTPHTATQLTSSAAQHRDRAISMTAGGRQVQEEERATPASVLAVAVLTNLEPPVNVTSPLACSALDPQDTATSPPPCTDDHAPNVVLPAVPLLCEPIYNTRPSELALDITKLQNHTRVTGSYATLLLPVVTDNSPLSSTPTLEWTSRLLRNPAVLVPPTNAASPPTAVPDALFAAPPDRGRLPAALLDALSDPPAT
jgi:hypothetical protein